MKPSTILSEFAHLREEEEESSESSSVVGSVTPGADAISISVMSSISISQTPSYANADTINVTRKTYSETNSEETNPHRAVCLEVFRNMWDEFYEWERGYCEANLGDLKRIRASGMMEGREKGASVTTTSTTTQTTRPSPTPTTITLALCTPNTLDLSSALDDFDADPVYESCTPLNGNAYVGDDPDVMPFLPFGEEDWDGYDGRKRFDYEGYIKEYSELGWMTAFDDPDLDCILYATTDRLASLSISYAQMDATGVFAWTDRLPLLGASDPPGLKVRAARRDFPPFPRLPSTHHPPSSPAFVLSTFQTQIYPLFCPNFTCVQQYCHAHWEKTPYPHPTKPERKSYHLATNEKDSTPEPCSPTCFLTFSSVISAPTGQPQGGLSGASRQATLPPWSLADRNTLIALLDLDADARPCDLAVVMRKRCDDIFRYRKYIFPDPLIITPHNSSLNPKKASLNHNSKQSLKPSKHGYHGARDNILVRKHETYTPPGPCYHHGPCDRTCPCVRANVQCERTCLCDDYCPLRKGCRCTPRRLPTNSSNEDGDVTKACCRTKHCPCRRAARACDPEECAGCAITDSRAPTCWNMAALWAAGGRRRKAVEVRQSAYGYGLFLKESILANEFIMEYTGELILDPTCISRDFIIKHRQRNYLFALNTAFGVDSSLAGDPSRFINHGNGTQSNLEDERHMGVGNSSANVYSRLEMANGGHGVVFYASVNMDAGTELLLDYGPKFFKELDSHDEESKEEGAGKGEEGEDGEEDKDYGDDDKEYGDAEEYRE